MEFVKEMFKIKIINIVTLLISIVIITSCAGKKPVEALPLEERYKRGQEFLENKKYYNAQQEFQIVVLSGSHTEWGDDAQFYLAESYFKNKEYILAITEYERLTRKMKFSPFVENSRWRICEAYVAESPNYYHDQSNTQKALQKLQEFIEEYNFQDFERLKNILLQYKAGMEASIVSTGHRYAISLSSRHLSKASYINELWHGISQEFRWSS